MSPTPDLFVVCKQCGSEVSPYITECPYCGARLRSRAPKLPRVKGRDRGLRRLTRLGAVTRPAARTGAPRSRLTQRRAYPRTDALPYATITLVAAGCAGWVAVRGGYVGFYKLAILGPLDGDWWKLLSSAFAYLDGLYAFVALLATAIFGWLLERRHGPVVVLVVFFGGAISGALAASAVYSAPVVSGAGGGALALIVAWSVPDLQDARRGDYYEGELLGAGAIAATLLLAPYARPEVSWLAGVVGAIVGLILGIGLHLIEPHES
ncbi:MAG: rhomboid family intramembrane serine protease [Solirubrobacteraceae bacterium]|jgi:membrane associated rhomboid family serine protease